MTSSDLKFRAKNQNYMIFSEVQCDDFFFIFLEQTTPTVFLHFPLEKLLLALSYFLWNNSSS